MSRPLAPLGLAAIALATACAGPPIPAPIEGLPVCPDFDAGHTKMEGGLRYPVRLRVLSGKDQVSKIIIVGLRRSEDIRPRTFVADDNAEFTLEWAQCENERAPRTVAEANLASGKAKDKLRESDTAYECGEATVYKTTKLITKKGDPKSHSATFVDPPKAACWTAPPAPPPPPAPAVVDAGAPPAADPDAGAAGVDAGSVGVDAGPAADAGVLKK